MTHFILIFQVLILGMNYTPAYVPVIHEFNSRVQCESVRNYLLEKNKLGRATIESECVELGAEGSVR